MTAQKSSSKNAKYNPFCAIFCKLFGQAKMRGEKQKCAQNWLYNNKSNDKTCFLFKVWLYEYIAFVCDWGGRIVYPTDFFSI